VRQNTSSQSRGNRFQQEQDEYKRGFGGGNGGLRHSESISNNNKFQNAMNEANGFGGNNNNGPSNVDS
jgi:hypothetical protein